MGLWKEIKDDLGRTFSFSQFIEVAGMFDDDYKEARNILNSWARKGYIRRVSRNIYEKI
ncbi:MAG: hypothetical protein ACTSWN_09200 [Promethearchaeota archaeon]